LRSVLAVNDSTGGALRGLVDRLACLTPHSQTMTPELIAGAVTVCREVRPQPS